MVEPLYRSEEIAQPPLEEKTMSRQNAVSLPLVEQIVGRWLEGLAQHNAFDAETLARLRALAESGGLANYQRVVSALGAEQGK